MEEALENANEAIACHLEGMLLDGEPLPKLKSINVHRKKADYADGIWAIVEVDLSRISNAVKRVQVSLPASLLNEVDVRARKAGESRSEVVAHAVMEYLTEDDEG